MIARARRLTPSRDPRAVERTIVEVVQRAARRRTRSVAVGIGAAGFVDADRAAGDVRPAPGLARTSRCGDAVGAAHRPAGDRSRTTPTPPRGRSGASAPGAARPRLVCVTLGTGIGGGIVIDGVVQRGRWGMAGEFGHMVVVPDGRRCECGNRGCLEQYASGNVLGREARELAEAGSPVTVPLMERVAAT